MSVYYNGKRMAKSRKDMNNTLTLVVKKKWFDMIVSGEKEEEYREFKPYWMLRLITEDGNEKKFDKVKFVNGYQKNAPFIICDFLETTMGYAKEGIGGEIFKEKCFVIKFKKI
jgi:hypothetical protein